MVEYSFFPYSPRDKQLELIDFIQKNIEKNDLIIEAPTGFGKTSVILAALIPFARKRDKKIIWAVRTGPETDRPIEELKIINETTKNKIMGISIRGKKDMCLLRRELSEDVDYEEVSFFCKRKIKNNECLYYKRLYDSKVPYQDKPLLYSEVLKFAEKNEICPYYYQLSQIYDSEVISVNYNYIFNENISWTLRNRINFNNSILVIDEAHNLQFLIRNLNMKEITLGTVRNAINEVNEFNLDRSFLEFLNKFEKYMIKILLYLKENNKEDIPLSLKRMLEFCEYEKYEGIENKMLEVGLKIRLRRMKENKAPRSSLYRLGEFLEDAIEKSGIEGVKLIANLKDNSNISIEIFDMRTKEIYSNIWNKFYRVVFCSGTIGPAKSFADIIGLKSYASKKIDYKYNKENFLTIITEHLTTKGEDLSDEMAKKYLNAIESFISSINENIAIFSASYRIQEKLIKYGLLDLVAKYKRRHFLERQDIQGDEARMILEEFKKSSKSQKGVLIASATGRFAEGADFPGKELEGIFLVGIPFDRLTSKTKLLMHYYVKEYGRRKGIFYSYVLPAIRRASHVLGRATRSPEDKAVFILGDYRYKRILKFLPIFSRINLKKVSSDEEISSLVSSFKF